MYPDNGGGAAEPMNMGGSLKSKLTSNLEGLIPLILIIIIVAFLAHKFNFIDLGFLPGFDGNDPMQMLIIGSPSADLQIILDQDRDLVKYYVKSSSALNISPDEQLAQYDVVMLYQAYNSNKAVSRQLGEAIESYVNKGGKLITVMDSGIYREVGLGNPAKDVVGWKATFGDAIPVECGPLENSVPSCTVKYSVHGVIYKQDFDHKIMEGIDRIPAQPNDAPLLLETFDVTPTGKIIASIQDVATPRYFPAIVERTQIVGKSIYFNYDPGKTRGVFENTLEYLR
ncbi:MAG: hypothetical protein V1672_01595 [Candidatus Diapherotrites archaeon]